MELDNVDVLLGMTIASVILGIGLSMFFIHPYTGYGAVVLAIGMMTLALMITARPRVIERVKKEIVLQPSKQAEPTPITPPKEVKSEETQTVESTQPSPEEKAPEKQEEKPITATPS